MFWATISIETAISLEQSENSEIEVALVDLTSIVEPHKHPG